MFRGGSVLLVLRGDLWRLAIRDLARRFRSGGSVPGAGTDRPGLVPPGPYSTSGGDTYAPRPRMRVRWGHRCRVVCPLGARAVIGPRDRRPEFPRIRPSPSVPSPRVTWQPRRVLRSQGLARGAQLGASAPSIRSESGPGDPGRPDASVGRAGAGLPRRRLPGRWCSRQGDGPRG